MPPTKRSAALPAPDPEEEYDGLDGIPEEGSDEQLKKQLADVEPPRALKTPNFTPVQIVSGIPILAELMHAYGVYDMSQAQQDSLGKAVTWAFVVIGSDAVIRVGRSVGSWFKNR